MKTNYILILTLCFTIFGMGQTPIAAISGDAAPQSQSVANITVSTPALTRVGITDSGDANKYVSRDIPTSAGINTGFYIQWSLTAGAGSTFTITEIQIAYSRNNQGPQNAVLRSSLDGFTSAIFTDTSVSATTETNTISTNLVSVAGGTITFRLYLYNAGNPNAARFTIEPALGTVLGQTNTAIRLTGFVVSPPVTYTYNGTWSPGDPNGIATNNDAIIITSGAAVINTNTACKSITVNPAGALTVNTGVTLSSVDGMTLESVSNQYASLIVDGTLSGPINYERHINDFQSTPNTTTGQNDLISPPLTSASQTFSVFKTANSNIPAGDIGGVPSWLFGPFNNNTNAYVNWTAANDGDLLVPGVGYRTASSTSTPNDTFVFTGDVQTTDVNVGISVGTGSEWNLIGNPFPSYLSADDFLNLTANNTLLDDNAVAIYGYDGTAQNGWDVINFNTTSGYNMAPGQGFLVAAKTSGSITFTTAMRRNTGSDDFIPNRNMYNPYLKLQMTSGTSSYHTDFYFNDNSTRGLDRGYDAGIFSSNLPNFYIYSHLVDDNQGRAMSIQSLGVSDLSDVVIPLGVKASQGQQITIGIQDTSLPANVQVYLEDNLTNTFTLLNTGDYTFTANANIDGTGRFFLRYSEDTLSNAEQDLNALQIFTTKTPSVLIINGKLIGKTTLSLYDILGRLVLTVALDDDKTSQHIQVSQLNSGMYVAKLSNGSQQKSQKVIIR